MNRSERRRQQKARDKANTRAQSQQASVSISDQQDALIQEALETAVQHHTTGRLIEAEKLYRQILELTPENHIALNLLGMIAHSYGNSDDAIELLTKSLTIQPTYSQALCNLGLILSSLGKKNEAVESFRKSLKSNPKDPSVLYNLGTTLRDLKQFEEAKQCLIQALGLDQNNSNIFTNLGLTLQDLDEFDESEKMLLKAAELEPEKFLSYYNIAQVFKHNNKPELAIKNYEKSISLKPDAISALNNLGNLYKDLGQYDKARDCFTRTLAIDPNYIESLFTMGMLDLMSGDFQNGWQGYSHRWKKNEYLSHPRNKHGSFLHDSFSGPPITDLKSANLKNKKAFVWMEQGVGDEIMFSSMLSDMSTISKTITVECDSRLVPLFARSFPEIEFKSSEIQTIQGYQTEDYDFQLPAGDMASHFRPSLQSFPTKISYLKSNQNQRTEYLDKYKDQFPNKKLVGISWKSKNKTVGNPRSLEINSWQSILCNPHCKFINLQYGDVEAELSYLKSEMGLDIYHDPTVDPIKDLDRFASQISALDLIISIDNSTVHMAGALGITTYVMLPFSTDWRWMINRDDCSWYQSLQLFRQTSRNDWEPVINQVRSALSAFVKPD